MRPITLKNPSLTKGPSSSDEFNKLRNDIQTDITTLFNIANEHESAIANNMDHVLRELYFLQNRLHKMEGQARQLQHDYQNSGSDESILVRSFYQASNVRSSSTNPVTLDTLHGLVSPVVVQAHNKIAYRNDLGEYLLPSTLDISVYESTDVQPITEETQQREYYAIDSAGIKQAFDGDKNSFWVRHAETNETECVTEVYGLVHVKIPQEISNNIYTNTITIHPSPEYSMSITDIQYKNQNGEWRRVDTYPVKTEGITDIPQEITEAGKMVFSFPKREVTEIQIKVKQPYWFQHDNKRIFMWGFQDIVAEYREYSQDAAAFVTEFSLEGTSRRFANISTPVMTVPVGSPGFSESNVKHELYFDAGLTEKADFHTDIFQTVQTIYVKTIMTTTGGYVPVLREIELPYRHEEIEIL